MPTSRVTQGLFVALLISAVVLTDANQGNFIATLRRLLAGSARSSWSHVSTSFLVPEQLKAEGNGRQLLEPLWLDEQQSVDSATGSAALARGLKAAAGEEMTLASADPDPDPQPQSAQRALRNEDFVYVAPCTPARLPLAQASRYWRKGMRAVFVLDQPLDKVPSEVVAGAARFHESFAWYPSFRRMANDKRDHYLEGDRRAALTPALAYAALANPDALSPYTSKAGAEATKPGADKTQPQRGNASADPFQWMLAGDDDTIFFMRGVKALLRNYDPQLPYFITDSMYVGSKSPQPGVWEMRCYPCHGPWGRWRRSSRRLMAESGGSDTSKGCGCSTAELCKRRFPTNQTLCVDEWEGPVPFGGVGFIFSIGFFKALAQVKHAKYGNALRAFENCVNAPETSVMSFPEGGDAFMSRCFWRLGLPITDPGYTKFGRYMGEILNLNELYEAPTNLTKGQLPRDALTRWSTAVSMHLGARQQRSFRAASMTIKYISGVYDLIAELLWPSVRKSEL